MLPTERTIKNVLCVWSSNCYVPSASQVTRMVSWSNNVWASTIEGAWPGPIVAIALLCDTGGRHRVWSVPRGWPLVLATWQVTARWSAARSTGQTQHLIMPSRNTSKDSSSVPCCLLPGLCYLNFLENFSTLFTHQARLWLSFTTKKPWNKDKVARLVMTIVHCKTEIIDFAAIQN